MIVCPACNGRKHIGHLGPLERCATCKGTGVVPEGSSGSALLDLYVDPAALSVRPMVRRMSIAGFRIGTQAFEFAVDEVVGHVSPRQMGRVALSVCEVMIPLRPTPTEANASTPDEWSFSVEVECEGVIVSMYSRARRRAFRRVIPESPTVDSWAAAVKDCHQIVCELLSECRATRPKGEA